MNYLSKYTDLGNPVKEVKICDSVLSPKFQQSKLYTYIINIPSFISSFMWPGHVFLDVFLDI